MEQRSTKFVWNVLGTIFLVLFGGVLVFMLAQAIVRDHKKDILATAIDSYVGPFLRDLHPMPDLVATVTVGKNAVWWIGEGVQYAGGGRERSTGAMNRVSEDWNSRFEELNSIIVVKGSPGEEKSYLRVPDGMYPFDITNNPFRTGPPSQFVDKNGRIHSADEFKETLRTYGLQVWILDVKSKQFVSYREFAAAPLLDSYDQDHTADEVHLGALTAWIESLEKLQKSPETGQQTGGEQAVDSQRIRLGVFSMIIPREWARFLPSEEYALAQLTKTQSKDIYQRYSGSPDQSRMMDFVCFHTQDRGTFIAMIHVVPPGSDLIQDLMKDAPQKANWGMQQGLIKSVSPVRPLVRNSFRGFYFESENSAGLDDIVGGLVNSKLSSDVIQITLMGVKSDAARMGFEKVLNSVEIAADRGQSH